MGAQVLRGLEPLAQDFAGAAPFRHVVIDGFFADAFARRLLAEFPVFERGNSVNENGDIGLKSTVEGVRELGGAWEEMDTLVRSRGFLEWLERTTGISGLLYDPHYFGGGSHENRNGQDLDPHVDFNRHPLEPWHRRLNLIVYLNPEWDAAWGGNLELHSDPRFEGDRVSTIEPLFNRCVIFETHDYSWHGFRRISLPKDRESMSRKSLALYFYTREAPKARAADPHSTIYVDRPLPPNYAPGLLLDTSHVGELRTLLARRDQHLQRLYRDLSRLEAECAALRGSALERIAHFARRALRALGR